MEKCMLCIRKPGIERCVNNEGVLFCSDDCYEEFEDSPNDNDHPYIYDYDALRFEYIEFKKSYEKDLYQSWNARTSKKEELLEGIESVIEEFYDYYRLEGADGIFSKEMYTYLLQLEELHRIISKWEPEEVKLKS